MGEGTDGQLLVIWKRSSLSQSPGAAFANPPSAGIYGLQQRGRSRCCGSAREYADSEYLKKVPLTPEQTDAILNRQYNRMLELGGNIYFTAKLGATDGHSFQHLAAVMTGNTQEGYAKMMLEGGRPVEGNRSKSGRAKAMKLGGKKSASRAKAKSAAKAKSKSKSRTKRKAKRG
jgi:protocatechuate 4,5-dioxygenase alpha subunit